MSPWTTGILGGLTFVAVFTGSTRAAEPREPSSLDRMWKDAGSADAQTPAGGGRILLPDPTSPKPAPGPGASSPQSLPAEGPSLAQPRKPPGDAPHALYCRGPLRLKRRWASNFEIMLVPHAGAAGAEGEKLDPGTCAFKDEPMIAYDWGNVDTPRSLVFGFHNSAGDTDAQRFWASGLFGLAASCDLPSCVLLIRMIVDPTLSNDLLVIEYPGSPWLERIHPPSLQP